MLALAGLAVVVGAAGAVAGPADPPKVLAAEVVDRATPVVVQRIDGEATWYGPGMEGGTTASGEPLDTGALTAAHPTLPFDTRVRVTGPQGEVVVRVNDRLPDQPDQRIDLTRAAFARVADVAQGRAGVTLEVLAPGA